MYSAKTKKSKFQILLGPCVYYLILGVNHIVFYKNRDLLESHLCYMTMSITT
ncbi:unnamed protein product [Prunus brigantina]